MKKHKQEPEGQANEPFWVKKSLFDMNKKEWESLCDGCGLCCLSKVEDEDTGEIYTTNVHCRLYDPKTCQCSHYRKRKQFVADCVVLTPKKAHSLTWLPKTCAYRILAKGGSLPDWHPLVSGCKDSTHKKGRSTKSMSLISEKRVKDLSQHIHSLIDVHL